MSLNISQGCPHNIVHDVVIKRDIPFLSSFPFPTLRLGRKWKEDGHPRKGGQYLPLSMESASLTCWKRGIRNPIFDSSKKKSHFLNRPFKSESMHACKIEKKRLTLYYRDTRTQGTMEHSLTYKREREEDRRDFFPLSHTKKEGNCQSSKWTGRWASSPASSRPPAFPDNRVEIFPPVHTYIATLNVHDSGFAATRDCMIMNLSEHILLYDDYRVFTAYICTMSIISLIEGLQGLSTIQKLVNNLKCPSIQHHPVCACSCIGILMHSSKSTSSLLCSSPKKNRKSCFSFFSCSVGSSKGDVIVTTTDDKRPRRE